MARKAAAASGKARNKKRGKDVYEPQLKDVLAFTRCILHQFFPFVNTLHKKSFFNYSVTPSNRG